MSTHLDPDLVQVRATGAVTVAVVVPEKFHGADAEIIGRQLHRLAELSTQLEVDLANVDSLDSMGLAKLIGLHKKVRSGGGELKLCNVHPFVYEIFSITNLTKLLNIQQRNGETTVPWTESA